eukprot:362910-Chlamydomonas_euryale.AAC.2
MLTTVGGATPRPETPLSIPRVVIVATEDEVVVGSATPPALQSSCTPPPSSLPPPTSTPHTYLGVQTVQDSTRQHAPNRARHDNQPAAILAQQGPQDCVLRRAGRALRAGAAQPAHDPAPRHLHLAKAAARAAAAAAAAAGGCREGAVGAAGYGAGPQGGARRARGPRGHSGHADGYDGEAACRKGEGRQQGRGDAGNGAGG